MKLSIPITHIILGDDTDALHLVRAVRGGRGIKVGVEYRMLAVNASGKVAVALDGNHAEPIHDDKGNMWYDMDMFEWRVPPMVATDVSH